MILIVLLRVAVLKLSVQAQASVLLLVRVKAVAMINTLFSVGWRQAVSFWFACGPLSYTACYHASGFCRRRDTVFPSRTSTQAASTLRLSTMHWQPASAMRFIEKVRRAEPYWRGFLTPTKFCLLPSKN